MVVKPNIIIMTNTKLSKLFITGCDHRTRWQLPWFEENFRKHNPNANLKIYDFDTQFPENAGWFKKPAAMVAASKKAEMVCWLDTDCEVLGNLNEIWNHVEPNKLSMAQDLPWSKRSGETWHNSGVVAFQGLPPILWTWKGLVLREAVQGDQETLHFYLRSGMNRMIHINDLPRRFNVLRIDHLDKTVPVNPLVYHWTGYKGNNIIRKQMNG